MGDIDWWFWQLLATFMGGMLFGAACTLAGVWSAFRERGRS